jgi:hypothetical protein
VYFGWNPRHCSQKIDLFRQASSLNDFQTDSLTNVKVRDGSGFKTVLGDITLSSGGKYYFVLKIVSGSLFKIGISSPQPNLEKVKKIVFNYYRLFVILKMVGLFIMESYVMVVILVASNLEVVSNQVT